MNTIARSPTQTLTWGQCPVKRVLAHDLGLRPRRVLHSEIAAIGGKAWARAMEEYNKGRQVNQIPDENTLQEIATLEIERGRKEWIEFGRELPDKEQAYNAGIEARVSHAIHKYLENDPLLGYSIEDVELVLPDHGNARIDLGVRDDFGLAVVDYKFKLTLKGMYLDREIERYRNSWQQFHYCWAYGEHMGVPIHNYMICLVVAEPKFSAKLYEFPVHPEAMEAWKVSAERIWAQMEHEAAGLTQPWMAPEHSTQFGPCEYQRACFDHRWDMNLMINSGDYVVAKQVD